MITYLYVKRHKVTGLKYFGKTIQNPYTYKGSGTYWKRHIKVHGVEFIETIDVWGFDVQSLCTEFAIKFSIDNNIVESSYWANLAIENGISGGPMHQGKRHSTESKKKMSNRRIGIPIPDHIRSKMSQSKIGCKNPSFGRSHSKESCIKMSNSRLGNKNCVGRILSEETKQKMSLSAKNRVRIKKG